MCIEYHVARGTVGAQARQQREQGHVHLFQIGNNSSRRCNRLRSLRTTIGIERLRAEQTTQTLLGRLLLKEIRRTVRDSDGLERKLVSLLVAALNKQTLNRSEPL